MVLSLSLSTDTPSLQLHKTARYLWITWSLSNILLINNFTNLLLTNVDTFVKQIKPYITYDQIIDSSSNYLVATC